MVFGIATALSFQLSRSSRLPYFSLYSFVSHTIGFSGRTPSVVGGFGHSMKYTDFRIGQIAKVKGQGQMQPRSKVMVKVKCC